MLRSQWVNLFVWYLACFASVVGTVFLYNTVAAGQFPDSPQLGLVSWQQLMVVAIACIILVAAADFSNSRYVLYNEGERTFDMVCVDEKEYWEDLATALCSFLLKGMVAIALLWLLGTFFPIKP